MKNKYWKLTIRLLLCAALSLLAGMAATALLYYAVYKIFDLPGGRYYTIRAYELFREFTREMPWLLWGCMTIVFFAALFFLLAKGTVKRLGNIQGAISQIRDGGYRVMLPNDKTDCLGELERAINTMAMQIENSFRSKEEIEQAKDDFIVNMAHDLRTPLTSIIGYLSFLTERELDPEISAKYARIAYEKAGHLENLVESLFDIARLTMDTAAINKEAVNLKKMLLQKQDEMFPQLQNAEMEIHLDVPDDLPQIHIDGELMARVFDNLIVNAVRYASEGSVLDVRVALGESRVLLSFVTHANPVPESELEHIFDKLYRLEKSRAAQTGGTGLGLSISRRIVELHGGTLTARQAEGGTAFDISLPL